MIKRLTIRKLTLFILLCYQPFVVCADDFITYDDGFVTYSDDGSLNHNRQTIPEKEIAPEPVAEVEEKSPVCELPSALYRKKIAAVYFPVQNPQHLDVVDYYDFDKGIGKELLRRLALSGDYLVKEAEHINLYPEVNIAPYIAEKETLSNRSLLSSIERKFNVQYVISGVIRDLSYSNINNNIKLPFGLSLDRDKFVSLHKQPKKPKKRNLVIDFYVHDALTEELISQRRYSESIDDSIVKPDHSIAFGTKEFFDSDYGKIFDKVIQLETDSIKKNLACQPYAMKILDQDKKDRRDKRNIYLNAGHNTRIKTGDILTMQRADREGGSFNSNSHRKQFGLAESSIKIIKVYPSYSVATSASEQVIHLERNTEYLLFW
ncbi:MAG: hypothetical protein KZQ83_00880 [gamma proteobacterium symbiont of Taylorina sp.]|nr:hypothetical protein [gamma proteobacterium symbiont of Taylorina sp.]